MRERRPALAARAPRPVLVERPERDCAPSWPCPCTSGASCGARSTCAVGRAGDAFDEDDARLVELVADHAGAALRTAELYRKLEQTHLGVAEALAAALEAKDGYTAEHARWIAELAVEVGRELELPEAELDDLRYGAIFHDIGKIAVPDAILNKPGPLTDGGVRGDQDATRSSASRSSRRCRSSPTCGEIVRHDHERWDGTGYPDGLRGAADPDRRADRARGGRLPRDDLRPPLPPGDERGPTPATELARQRRHAVRPRRGGRDAGRAGPRRGAPLN